MLKNFPDDSRSCALNLSFLEIKKEGKHWYIKSHLNFVNGAQICIDVRKDYVTKWKKCYKYLTYQQRIMCRSNTQSTTETALLLWNTVTAFCCEAFFHQHVLWSQTEGRMDVIKQTWACQELSKWPDCNLTENPRQHYKTSNNQQNRHCLIQVCKTGGDPK